MMSKNEIKELEHILKVAGVIEHQPVDYHRLSKKVSKENLFDILNTRPVWSETYSCVDSYFLLDENGNILAQQIPAPCSPARKSMGEYIDEGKSLRDLIRGLENNKNKVRFLLIEQGGHHNYRVNDYFEGLNTDYEKISVGYMIDRSENLVVWMYDFKDMQKELFEELAPKRTIVNSSSKSRLNNNSLKRILKAQEVPEGSIVDYVDDQKEQILAVSISSSHRKSSDTPRIGAWILDAGGQTLFNLSCDPALNYFDEGQLIKHTKFTVQDGLYRLRERRKLAKYVLIGSPTTQTNKIGRKESGKRYTLYSL